MNLIKPEKLKKGDTICIIAPCGNVTKEKILSGKKYLEDSGYNVELGENVFSQDRYLAGGDDLRIYDLEQAFARNDIKAIICARGGYGALRIIDKINYDIIKKNPKIFCGYSDVSALSLAILNKTGLITYSSPMIEGDFQPDNISEFTITNFFNTLSSDSLTLIPNKKKIYKEGIAEGILWGGNLATVASVCGFGIIPDRDFVFFAEDLNEPVYKIDRYFRQLINTPDFRKNVKGLIFGEFLDVENSEELEILFNEISSELNIPSFGTYSITHGKDKLTLPIGAKAKLDDGNIFINF